jgi:hypothetical protein
MRKIRDIVEHFTNWVNSSEENNIKDYHIIESYIEHRKLTKEPNIYPRKIKCSKCEFPNLEYNKYCFNCNKKL